MTGDEIRAHRERCADCSGPLREIRVLQNSFGNVGKGQVPLVFASSESEANKWTSDYPLEGVILAFACTSCARVVFCAATEHED